MRKSLIAIGAALLLSGDLASAADLIGATLTPQQRAVIVEAMEQRSHSQVKGLEPMQRDILETVRSGHPLLEQHRTALHGALLTARNPSAYALAKELEK